MCTDNWVTAAPGLRPLPALPYPHRLPEEVVGHVCFPEIKGCSTHPRCRQKLAPSTLAYVTVSLTQRVRARVRMRGGWGRLSDEEKRTTTGSTKIIFGLGLGLLHGYPISSLICVSITHACLDKENKAAPKNQQRIVYLPMYRWYSPISCLFRSVFSLLCPHSSSTMEHLESPLGEVLNWSSTVTMSEPDRGTCF